MYFSLPFFHFEFQMNLLYSFYGERTYCLVRYQATFIIEPTLEEREANADV